jgi:hypothetical protein
MRHCRAGSRLWHLSIDGNDLPGERLTLPGVAPSDFVELDRVFIKRVSVDCGGPQLILEVEYLHLNHQYVRVGALVRCQAVGAPKIIPASDLAIINYVDVLKLERCWGIGKSSVNRTR